MAATKPGSKTPKRSDLQAIRGIAIFAVLLFHFFPSWFPNGYVGVDQFFVLSGYLIASVLDSKVIGVSSVGTFYYRRIKRIVPLYVFLIFIVLLALFTVFPPSNLQLNLESASNALCFMTNIAGISPDKDYAAMLALAVDAFTHTWSLAVEMQFYLLVPFIFYLHNIFKFRGYTIIIIAATSFLYSITVDPGTAFNSVFARLWQFCVGIGSLLLVNALKTDSAPDEESLLGDGSEETDEISLTSRSSVINSKLIISFIYLLLGMAIFQEFYTVIVPSGLLRFNVTILTGAIIVLGSKEIVWPMTNKALVYLGDISYALYLVHWPIYTYVKLNYDDEPNFLLVAFVSSVLLAIIITETFEKFYLQLDKSSICTLISVLYAVIIVILMNSSIISQKLDPKIEPRDQYFNISLGDAIRLNSQWSNNDLPQLRSSGCKVRPDGGCQFTPPNNISRPGPSILIWGNSYAANVAGIVNDSCAEAASKITMKWEGACDILVTTPSYKHCHVNATDGFLERVRIEKPDILFLLVRYTYMMSPLVANTSIMDDAYYKEAHARLSKYEALVTKSIYILNSIPKPVKDVVKVINKGLAGNYTLTLAHLQDKQNYYAGRVRLEALVKNCAKCRMVDYLPYLEDKGEFQFFDRSNGLSYFTHGFHLTPLGLKRVKPAFEKACQAL